MQRLGSVRYGPGSYGQKTLTLTPYPRIELRPYYVRV